LQIGDQVRSGIEIQIYDSQAKIFKDNLPGMDMVAQPEKEERKNTF
jgi:hypothetical protein